MQYQLNYGSSIIEFSIQYLDRKTLGIKVHPEGRVEVLAPLMASEQVVIEKVKIKAPWILKQLKFFEIRKPKTPERRFISGETHLYLGRQYRLKVIQDKENFVKVFRGQILLHSPKKTSADLDQQLNSWYRQKASIIFNEMIEEVWPKFSRYKIRKPPIIIRNMRKRWGSCTPTGKIILNTELIKTPKGCIEYVIVHELSHLIHFNHNKQFKNLQSRVLPDWEKWKNRLESWNL